MIQAIISHCNDMCEMIMGKFEEEKKKELGSMEAESSGASNAYAV